MHIEWGVGVNHAPRDVSTCRTRALSHTTICTSSYHDVPGCIHVLAIAWAGSLLHSTPLRSGLGLRYGQCPLWMGGWATGLWHKWRFFWCLEIYFFANHTCNITISCFKSTDWSWGSGITKQNEFYQKIYAILSNYGLNWPAASLQSKLGYLHVCIVFLLACMGGSSSFFTDSQ